MENGLQDGLSQCVKEVTVSGPGRILKYPLISGNKLPLNQIKNGFGACCGCTYQKQGDDEPTVVFQDRDGNLIIPETVKHVTVLYPVESHKNVGPKLTGAAAVRYEEILQCITTAGVGKYEDEMRKETVKICGGKLISNKKTLKTRTVFFGWMHVDYKQKSKSFASMLPNEPKCDLDQSKFYSAQDLKEMAYNLIWTRENRGYFESSIVEFGLYNGQRIEKFGDKAEDVGLWEWNRSRGSPRSELRFYLWTKQQFQESHDSSLPLPVKDQTSTSFNPQAAKFDAQKSLLPAKIDSSGSKLLHRESFPTAARPNEPIYDVPRHLHSSEFLNNNHRNSDSSNYKKASSSFSKVLNKAIYDVPMQRCNPKPISQLKRKPLESELKTNLEIDNAFKNSANIHHPPLPPKPVGKTTNSSNSGQLNIDNNSGTTSEGSGPKSRKNMNKQRNTISFQEPWYSNVQLLPNYQISPLPNACLEKSSMQKSELQEDDPFYVTPVSKIFLDYEKNEFAVGKKNLKELSRAPILSKHSYDYSKQQAHDRPYSPTIVPFQKCKDSSQKRKSDESRLEVDCTVMTNPENNRRPHLSSEDVFNLLPPVLPPKKRCKDNVKELSRTLLSSEPVLDYPPKGQAYDRPRNASIVLSKHDESRFDTRPGNCTVTSKSKDVDHHQESFQNVARSSSTKQVLKAADKNSDTLQKNVSTERQSIESSFLQPHAEKYTCTRSNYANKNSFLKQKSEKSGLEVDCALTSNRGNEDYHHLRSKNITNLSPPALPPKNKSTSVSSSMENCQNGDKENNKETLIKADFKVPLIETQQKEQIEDPLLDPLTQMQHKKSRLFDRIVKKVCPDQGVVVKKNPLNNFSSNTISSSSVYTDPYGDAGLRLEKIRLKNDSLNRIKSLEIPAINMVNLKKDVSFVSNKPIGAGAFGCVFKARYQGAFVAVKKIARRGTSERHIFREVEILSRMKHDYVIAMRGFTFDTEYVYILTEFFEGKTLRAAFGIEKFDFSAKNKHRVSQQISGGLAYLHRPDTQCLHRDLKPENIMIDFNYKIKIIDFGLSKIHDDDNNSCRLYRPGTFKYMAPEVFKYQSAPTCHSDMWSLGCVLYEIYFGKQIWPKTREDVALNFTVEQQMRELYRNENILPEGLNVIQPKIVSLKIKACLDFVPGNRPSAQELLDFYEKLVFKNKK